MREGAAMRRPMLSALPAGSLLLTVAALVLWYAAGPAPAALVFDRVAIGDGQWWRLISGHWVHSDAPHALWNISALAVLSALLEPALRWRLLAALLAGMLAVDAWLWWGLPGMQRYCGLSGILNAVLAAGVIALWRETRDPLVGLVGFGAVVKVVAEMTLGQALFTHTAWASVPTAHAAGLLAGAAAELLAGWKCERALVTAISSCPSRTDG
jgi:rhomboid family GlyGly-CTERM serine protease